MLIAFMSESMWGIGGGGGFFNFLLSSAALANANLIEFISLMLVINIFSITSYLNLLIKGSS